MPIVLVAGGAAAAGWLAGLFSSDGLANLLQWALVIAAAVVAIAGVARRALRREAAATWVAG